MSVGLGSFSESPRFKRCKLAQLISKLYTFTYQSFIRSLPQPKKQHPHNMAFFESRAHSMIDADCYSDVDLPSHPSPPASEAGSSLLLWRANTSEGDAKAHARVLRERSKQAQRSRKRLAAILKSQLVYSRSLNGERGAQRSVA